MDTINLFGFVYGFGVASPQDYNDKKTNDEGMVSRDIDSSAQPGSFMMTAGLYDFLSVQPAREDAEEDLYFYHGDHLGSTAYITDASGVPSQHVAYIPFGEVLLEEKAQTWQSPYKFNCKELDEESGLYYYGARYYDPKSSVFLGVDPLADSFPSWTPYRYCFDNPINVTDKSGMNEDGFIATWDEVKQEYNKKKVNNMGGEKTDYTEFRGGTLDGQLQIYDNTNSTSQWRDISTSEISPVTGGPTGKGALKNASWIIDIVAGGGVSGLLKSGTKAAVKEGGRLALRSDIVLNGGRSGQMVKNLTGPANSAIKGNRNRMFITNDAGKVIWDITKDRAKTVIPGQGFGSKTTPTQQHLELLNQLWGK